MRLTKSQLNRIILEETGDMLTLSHPSEVEPIENAFSGGENLVLPIDHSKAVGSEPVTDSPEQYSYEEERVIQMTEAQLRKSIQKILRKSR